MERAKHQNRQRPTMQMIAKMAGVSRSTVSHILANHVEFMERFKPDTVTRVREIARDLGYTANLMALSLRAPHPSFFALVLRGEDKAETMWYHQAVEAQFQSGALDASCALGLYPVLVAQDSRDPKSALARVRGVLDGGVLGAVVRRPEPVLHDTLCEHIKLGLPVVVVFPNEDAYLPTNCINLDNEATGRLAAEVLLAAGRRRLVVVQDARNWTAIRLRAEGFMAAAREAGAHGSLEMIPHTLPTDRRKACLADRLRELRPDGLYASSANTGVESLLACQMAVLRVPEDTALVGSDTALWPAAGDITITSVDVSRYEAGWEAVHKLIDLTRGGESTFANVSLPPRARAGGTCPVVERATAAQR